MNILVLNGSPKGGRSNTYRLTGAFLEGIALAERDSGHSAPLVDTLELCALRINPCLGCFACWSKTPGVCCLEDDMPRVIERLLWADVVIWSFPLYYFGVPGPLKNLIDRQLPMSLPFMDGENQGGGHPPRYDMSGKKNVLISTCGFYTPKDNYESVSAMFDRFWGKGGYTSLFCGQGELFRVKELSKRTEEYLSFVRQAGAEYAAGGIAAQTWERLKESLYPRPVFEAMADASWGLGAEGEREEASLAFTRQMAALYNKSAYPGQDIVLEMNYTDIGKAYRVILGREGSRVEKDLSGPYTTRISTPYTLWRAIAAGEIQGAEALMKQLYRVEGDFTLMLRWDDYFGPGAGAKEGEGGEGAAKQSKTNMNMLLAPWLVFWIAAAVNGFWGSLGGLAACVLTPLVFFKNRRTLYDALSLAAAGGCSIALLAGVPAVLVMPLSYLLFGVMWSGSCLTKIPLTAHYSMNGYGGEEALANPLFIKTNRILTAAWGLLYLLTPIWTYSIMKGSAAAYVGAVNAVLPALMGIFTAWFQRWYPRRVARGS